MYLINKASTGITEIDNGLTKYFSYLANINVLPEGTYVLAGGSIRSLLDKSTARDLDIYILGDKTHHDKVLDEVSDRSDLLNAAKFCNPFAHFKLINIKPELIPQACRDFTIPKVPKAITGDGDDPFFSGPEEIDPWPVQHYPEDFVRIPIQLISFQYDSHYYERTPALISCDDRYADTSVSSLSEIVGSFDITVAKGAVEFIVGPASIIVTSINIPHDCLFDICMRKVRLSVNDGIVPQQLCTLKRFHKYVKLGYDVDEIFYATWKERFKHNPHVLELSYD